MSALYKIRFLPEGREIERCGSRGNWYELEDGSRLKVQTTPIWCRRCNGITEGEQVESLGEIDQRLAGLRDPTSERYVFRRHVRDHAIEETEKRRPWRERRVSPAKCIRCGATDIVVFPMDVEIPNPAGPGTVEVTCIGLCTPAGSNNWSFTPEGDRMPSKASAT
jgi:hypothetical protein